MLARGGAMAGGLVLAVAVTGCGGNSTAKAPRPAVTPTVTATVSTPVSTTPPTATPKATPTGTPPAGAPLGLVVTGAGSALTPPAAPTTKTVGTEQYPGCYGLGDTGFQYQSCVRVSSPLGVAIALVEVGGTSERDLVYTVSGSNARLALRRIRTLPAVLGDSGSYNPDATTVLSSDLADDNTAKVVFYTPVTGSPGSAPTAYDAVDVVEADGKVVVHRNLQGGVARKAFGGGLETWTPVGGGNADHGVFQYTNGAWRLTVSGVVNSDTIPAQTGTF